MSFVYIWVFFLFIPLYLFYKTDIKQFDEKKQFQRRLLFTSLALMLLAMARPVITHSINEQKFDAQDFIIALDASYSMQADDIKPSRYEAAKENIKAILQSLPNNRFSIFAFTSNAMLISPPTTDIGISLIALNALNPKYILTKGTSLYALLQTIAKTSYDKKKLIIFTDGGEDHNLQRLVATAKQYNIVPYVVAVGSDKGAVLHDNGKNLEDVKGNLVISRINPILKNFALQSGGKYYELSSNSFSALDELLSDLSNTQNNDEESKIHVLTYTELFWIPLALALIFFFIAVTKIHQLFFLSLLMFSPYEAHSSLLDFYHLDKAQKSYNEKKYKNAAAEFSKLPPSVQSYYNMGVAYYKDKQYKSAIKIFSKIKSKDPKIKQNLYYNMGNCAQRLKKYDRAKIYYQKALGLGFDKQAYENLMNIYGLQEKVDISDMLPPNETDTQTQASKNNNTKKDESKSSSKESKSNQKAAESSNGSASNKGKETQKPLKKNDTINKSQYKLGYKAYELINKGYTNEKHPW